LDPVLWGTQAVLIVLLVCIWGELRHIRNNTEKA